MKNSTNITKRIVNLPQYRAEGYSVSKFWHGVEQSVLSTRPLNEKEFWFIAEGMLAAAWLEDPAI